MLPPVMEDGVLGEGEGDGGLVVHHQRRWASFFPDELTQQPAQPYSLARRRGRYDVLYFAR
jgi:hypothetical protein